MVYNQLIQKQNEASTKTESKSLLTQGIKESLKNLTRDKRGAGEKQEALKLYYRSVAEEENWPKEGKREQLFSRGGLYY